MGMDSGMAHSHLSAGIAARTRNFLSTWMAGACALGGSIDALSGYPHGEASYSLPSRSARKSWRFCFASGASVDSALGRIGSATVRGRATGEHLQYAQSAFKCHWTGWAVSPQHDESRVSSARPAPVVIVCALLLLNA